MKQEIPRAVDLTNFINDALVETTQYLMGVDFEHAMLKIFPKLDPRRRDLVKVGVRNIVDYNTDLLRNMDETKRLNTIMTRIVLPVFEKIAQSWVDRTTIGSRFQSTVQRGKFIFDKGPIQRHFKSRAVRQNRLQAIIESAEEGRRLEKYKLAQDKIDADKEYQARMLEIQQAGQQMIADPTDILIEHRKLSRLHKMRLGYQEHLYVDEPDEKDPTATPKTKRRKKAHFSPVFRSPASTAPTVSRAAAAAIPSPTRTARTMFSTSSSVLPYVGVPVPRASRIKKLKKMMPHVYKTEPDAPLRVGDVDEVRRKQLEYYELEKQFLPHLKFNVGRTEQISKTIFINPSGQNNFVQIVVYPKTTLKAFIRLAHMLINHVSSMFKHTQFELRRKLDNQKTTILVGNKKFRKHTPTSLGHYLYARLKSIRTATELHLVQTHEGGSLFSILAYE